MNKFQIPNTLKVRKAFNPNHNEIALKVRKGLINNHNESGLKIRKGTLKERWTMFLYANIRCGWMNHNQTALKISKGWDNHNQSALRVRK